MVFVAAGESCLAAPLTVRGFRVYRSEAQTLDQKKRADQAQILSQEGQTGVKPYETEA